MFENPRRGRQARGFTTDVPKSIDLKSSSEQIFSENCRWVPLSLKSWFPGKKQDRRSSGAYSCHSLKITRAVYAASIHAEIHACHSFVDD